MMLLMLLPLLLTGAPASASPVASTVCNASSFPRSLLDTQCFGSATRVPSAGTAAACLSACCEAEACALWNFADGSHRQGKVNGCWIGGSDPETMCTAGRLGWVGGMRASPPLPPPPGPAPLPAGAAARLDLADPALEFDGLGAIIDASSRLMFDYPEPERSEIMDYLFKPHFGASLSIAKVEVGGDAQQTDGTTASYRHNTGEPVNFNRSHIWWAMREAKSRHPGVRFYGLGWGFPGYLGSFYSNATADYLADWVAGARAAHGFNVSVLGLWNERQPCIMSGPDAIAVGGGSATSWNCDVIFALREALDARGLSGTLIAGVDHQPEALAGVVQTNAPIGVVATHGPPSLDPEMVAYFRGKGAHFWRSEGEETYASSGMVAHRLVRDFVEYGAQASIAWPIVQGFYPVLPWGQYDMFFGAHSPWSGHYGVPSSVWVYAHLSQFAEPGWEYLGGPNGSGFLSGGGAFCALVSPDRTELTLLIETLSTPNCTTKANCPTAATQAASFVLPASARRLQEEGEPQQMLEVWESQLTTNNPAQYMIKRARGVAVAANGSFTLAVPLNTLLTVTTALGLAQKGHHPPPPPIAPFPLPYAVNYSTLPLSRQGLCPYESHRLEGFF